MHKLSTLLNNYYTNAQNIYDYFGYSNKHIDPRDDEDYNLPIYDETDSFWRILEYPSKTAIQYSESIENIGRYECSINKNIWKTKTYTLIEVEENENEIEKSLLIFKNSLKQ